MRTSKLRLQRVGNFIRHSVIDKNDASTLIPCTEDSSSRAGSKIAPYPLHDKLSYVAGDFVEYGGQIKKEEPFSYYIKQLQEWAESPYAHPKVKSIYQYLSKGRLIKDLVAEKILFLDHEGQLISTWDKKYEGLHGDKPAIFGTVTGGQESAFIRFNVYSSNEILKKVWKDQEIYDSFIRYYEDLLSEEDLCFVTGKILPSTERHANKIRNAADKAKLISANDTSGFTYRGRFNKSQEVASISYDVSQKAHNALKWLINHQGKIVDQRVFLVWGNKETNIPEPGEDSYDIFSSWNSSTDPESDEKEIKSYTHEDFANEVAKAIDGYRNRLETVTNDQINILILDSATTGRLAVLYYRNMNTELYFSRLKNWHSTCVWIHRYRKNKEGKLVPFRGAPSTKDIAFAAYGPKANEKVVKGLMERMLPCIVDEQKNPIRYR